MPIKNKIHLILPIFGLFAVLVAVFFVYYLFSEIKEKSEELVVRKEQFIVLEERIFNLEKFRDLYPDLRHFLEKTELLLIDSKVPIEFIDFLEKNSEKTNLQIEITSLSDKKTEKDFWPYLTFQIVCSGDFSDFLLFLERLENGPYLVETQNINLSKLVKEKDTFSDDIRANFSVKVFIK